MSTLTVRNLIQYYSHQIRQKDRSGSQSIAGKEPHFPMLVVFLGEDAIKGFPGVASDLLDGWPQYQSELLFIGVTKAGEGLDYSRLTLDGGETHSAPIQADEISELASGLFDEENHFQNYSKLLVYYVLNTTDHKDAADFMAWVDTMDAVRQAIGVGSQKIMDMLIVLFNENLARQSIADEIRNKVYEYYDQPALFHNCKSLFLISNKRSDDIILKNWNLCYNLIADLITLSNNSETRITSAMFDRKVLAASYAREEKPADQIGQVIVTKLIDALAGQVSFGSAHVMKDESISERLGINPKTGTIEILDEYAKSALVKSLPTPEDLQLFPRRSMDYYDALEELSCNEFNNRTMNAWDSYLALIVKRASNKVQLDSKLRIGWRKEYTARLLQEFSLDELMDLGDHMTGVNELFHQGRQPSRDVPVLSAAKAQLNYMLSSDETLIKIFTEAIAEQGDKARDVMDAWEELVQSKSKVFALHDENLIAFYENLIRNYLDHHGKELVEAFKQIQNIDSMQQLLESTLDKIIESDSIYTASFEQELEARLDEDSLKTNAKQYIRQKLTQNDMKTYLQVNFSMGNPILSAILIKVGTGLYENLHENLSPTTYYYNTGCGNVAEALNVYMVSRENLITGKAGE